MYGLLRSSVCADFWRKVSRSTFFAPILADMYSRAKSYDEAPQNEDYELFCEFWKSGNRASYEASYYKKRDYMNIYATLSLIEPENNEYIRRLENVIWTICNEFTWCITPHLGGERREPEEYREEIDLFAAETASALSEIKYMLADRLSPLICKRIHSEIGQRIKKPFSEKIFHWENRIYNWNAVCSGCVGTALIYEYPQCFEENKARIIDNMQRFLSGYLEDGACVEGLGYWGYGFGYFICFAQLLREYSNGETDLLKGEKQRQIAMFQQKMYLCGGKRATFADTESSVTHYYVGLTHFLAREYEGVRIPVGIGFPQYASNDNCFHWMLHIRNFLWADTNAAALPTDEENYMSARGFYSRINDYEGYGFFAKAGRNRDAHAHCDVGGFMFVKGRDAVIDDAGSGEYSAATFGAERNLMITHSSLGHSVPIVNGCCQHWDESARGVMSHTQRDRVSVEMQDAYPPESGVLTMTRQFDISGSLRITDSFTLMRDVTELRERFTTRLRVDVRTDGRVLLIGDFGSYEIVYDRNVFYPEVSTEYFTAIYGRRDYINVVDLVCKCPAVSLTAEIVFTDSAGSTN